MHCYYRFLGLILSLFTLSITAHGSGADLDMPRVSWQDLMDLEFGHEPALLEGLILEGNRPIEVVLEPFTILSDIGVVVVENREGTRFLQEEDIVHLYRGHVLGQADSQIYIGATDKRINGFIQVGEEFHIISSGPVTPRKSEQLHITPLEGDLDAWLANGPFCRVDEIEQPFAFPLPQARERSGASRGECVLIELAIDSDWEYTSNIFGGDAEASAAYALTLSGAVSEIYVTDMLVRLEVNYVRTWDSNSDPYDNPNNNEPESNLLYQFKDHWNAQMSWVDRDVAHILSSPFSGGLAWRGVLCHSSHGYAASGGISGTFPYPLEDNNHGNWDLIVMAHELGHNFGSTHTHDFDPPIDGCGLGDCTDAHLGTIMSYCHLCPGYLSNIRLGFHELCQNMMYGHFADQSCDAIGDCAPELIVPSFAYPTIQSAINQAVDGDVIQIMAGTYTLGAPIDTLSKAIQLLGAELDPDGNPTTIIDGDGDVRLLLCQGPSTGSDHATFTNLEFRNGGGNANGGGARIDNSTPVFEYSIFSNCSANETGGSVLIATAGNPSFNECSFRGGTALTKSGGEVRIIENSGATFTQCAFGTPGNVSEARWGGHVSLAGASLVTFEDCAFENGQSERQGGSIIATNSSQLILDGCSFLDCHSTNFNDGNTSNGGGLCLLSSSQATIQGSSFTGCSIQGANAGSTIYADAGCNLSLNYCTLTGNFVENGSGTSGGAIHAEGDVAELYLSNTILCDNQPENITGDPYTDGGGNCLAVSCDDNDSDGLPDECGPPTGACCIGSNCTITQEADCGGDWHGEDTSCGGFACSDFNFQGLAHSIIGTELVEDDDFTWSVDVYALIGPGERLDAVAGDANQQKTITTSTSFHQDPLGGPTSQSINPALFETFPELRYDSFVTIGSLDSSGNPYPENALSDIGIDWNSFESGGDLSTGDGAWFISPKDNQGEPQSFTDQDCSSQTGVLVARLTVRGNDAQVHVEALFQGRDDTNTTWQSSAGHDISYDGSLDCNGNTVPDACDIANGDSEDVDGNGIPDECEGEDCTGDIDGSGAIGVDDLLSIIAAWGGNDADADLNEDGIVGVDDLLIVIAGWGPCP